MYLSELSRAGIADASVITGFVIVLGEWETFLFLN